MLLLIYFISSPGLISRVRRGTLIISLGEDKIENSLVEKVFITNHFSSI